MAQGCYCVHATIQTLSCDLSELLDDYQGAATLLYARSSGQSDQDGSVLVRVSDRHDLKLLRSIEMVVGAGGMNLVSDFPRRLLPQIHYTLADGEREEGDTVLTAIEEVGIIYELLRYACFQLSMSIRRELSMKIMVHAVEVGISVYAVIETGGKQYKVIEGQTIEVEKLPQEVGETVELDRVLLVVDDDKVVAGTPTVDGAMVSATVVLQARRRKVIVFKYKARERYRRKKGHRQAFTRLRIGEIRA